jgi:hypothetical protein
VPVWWHIDKTICITIFSEPLSHFFKTAQKPQRVEEDDRVADQGLPEAMHGRV